METRILLKGKGREKDIKYQYPKCPSCGNADYKKLSVCHQCSFLVCEKCKGVHA